MKRSVATLTMAVGLFLPPPLVGQVADTAAVVNYLRPGDEVRITVWRQPELSGDFLIGDDGSISHPLYRELRIAWKDPITVDLMVRDFLSRFETNPAFVVAPLFRVALGGEIRNPNLYSLRPETSVAQAVALAGGPTDRGRLDRIHLLRRGQVWNLDLTNPNGTDGNILVQSGDQLIVTRRSEVFRSVIVPLSTILATVLSAANLIITLR